MAKKLLRRSVVKKGYDVVREFDVWLCRVCRCFIGCCLSLVIVALRSFLVLFNGILVTSMPMIWEPFCQLVNPIATILYASSHGSLCAILHMSAVECGASVCDLPHAPVHAPRRCHSASSHG